MWGLFGPKLADAVLPTETIRAAIGELFDDDPSPSDIAVDEYVRVVRRATAWERPPTIYGPSVSYFKKHFAAMDPDRHHDFPDVRTLQPAALMDLAVGAPLFAGRPILISGPLAETPTVVTPGRRGTVSWAFVVRDPDLENAVVLARVPVRTPLTLDRGQRVSISGIVMADGAARYGDSVLTRVVYIAGSSIAPSTRVTLKLPQRRRP